jgi:acetylornithine deacetylase/succinyl-diaminopimelate desuccinylase-like protein
MMERNENQWESAKKEIDQWLISMREDPQWKAQARDWLVELIEIDNTPKPTAQQNAQGERQVFDIIERQLKSLAPTLKVEFIPLRTDIYKHPFFIPPYYTEDHEETIAALAEKVFRNRGNLFARWEKADKPILAMNAHVDNVLPFLPVRTEGDKVFGRGTVDDKAGCLTMILMIGLLTTIARRFNVEPECQLLLQFVIDEERGGNGGLSAALEKKVGNFNDMIVIEPTSLQVCPGNRGVIWYKIQLENPDQSTASLLEASAFVILALEQNCRKLKSESKHPLWPQPPVHTCHGILGSCGQHPSRVNDYIPLHLRFKNIPGQMILEIVEAAVKDYCIDYGDKTQSGSASKTLQHHFVWTDLAAFEAKLEIFGISGHMGGVERLDGAITKASKVIERLVRARQKNDPSWKDLDISIFDDPGIEPLILEGGQGYIPTHTNIQICESMERSMQQGISEYLNIINNQSSAVQGDANFEKRLHNHPFAFDLNGPFLNLLLEALQDSGIHQDLPLRGMDCSCDARFFVKEFPQAEVMTFGPGPIPLGHSDEEHIDIKEILMAAEAMARTALIYGRSR